MRRDRNSDIHGNEETKKKMSGTSSAVVGSRAAQRARRSAWRERGREVVRYPPAKQHHGLPTTVSPIAVANSIMVSNSNMVTWSPNAVPFNWLYIENYYYAVPFP